MEDAVMSPKLSLAALCVASAASGCAVGPDYVKPDMPLPESDSRGRAAVEQRVANTAADLPAWWAGFSDPLLTRFVQLALEQNTDLAQPSPASRKPERPWRCQCHCCPPGNVAGGRAHQSVETPLGRVLNAQPGFDRYGNAFEADLNASWGWMYSAACVVAARRRTPTTGPHRRVQLPHGWPWPHRPPISTSPSAAYRRA